MNISLWNFKPSSASLGTLTDKLSGNTVNLVGAARHQFVTSSVGKEMAIRLERARESNFLVDIEGDTKYGDTHALVLSLKIIVFDVRM